jgi:hypothetical protein
MDKEIEGIYLELSEQKNAIDYLEKASWFINQANKDTMSWKWVVISLHGALYGFAICASKRTTSESVINKNGYLIGFWDALKRCQDPKWMSMLTTSKHLTLSNSQKESIRILKNLIRNNIEHFKPKTWLLELHGISQIAIDTLEVIKFLALETNTHVNLTESQRKVVKDLINKSKATLKASAIYKETKKYDL